MSKGFNDRERRCSIRVFPSINIIGKQNENTTHLQVTNTSSQTRSLGKGTKIAFAHSNFTEVEMESEKEVDCINVISDQRVMELICSRKDFPHLTDEQYVKVESLLSEMKKLDEQIIVIFILIRTI